MKKRITLAALCGLLTGVAELTASASGAPFGEAEGAAAGAASARVLAVPMSRAALADRVRFLDKERTSLLERLGESDGRLQTEASIRHELESIISGLTRENSKLRGEREESLLQLADQSELLNKLAEALAAREASTATMADPSAHAARSMSASGAVTGNLDDREALAANVALLGDELDRTREQLESQTRRAEIAEAALSKLRRENAGFQNATIELLREQFSVLAAEEEKPRLAIEADEGMAWLPLERESILFSPSTRITRARKEAALLPGNILARELLIKTGLSSDTLKSIYGAEARFFDFSRLGLSGRHPKSGVKALARKMDVVVGGSPNPLSYRFGTGEFMGGLAATIRVGCPSVGDNEWFENRNFDICVVPRFLVERALMEKIDHPFQFLMSKWPYESEACVVFMVGKPRIDLSEKWVFYFSFSAVGAS